MASNRDVRAKQSVLHCLAAAFFSALLVSCSSGEVEPEASTSSAPPDSVDSSGLATHPVNYTEAREACADYSEIRKPLFGDLHVHTALSFDAVAGRINTMPEDAFNYARGRPVASFPQNELGEPIGTITIDRPLDFLSVTDHSEFLGERALCTDPDSSEFNGEFCTQYREIEFRGTLMVATSIWNWDPNRIEMLCGSNGDRCLEASQEPWQRIIDAADAAYDRSDACSFTSFVGYEYTGGPGGSNYHRNVIFRNANVPDLPVSFFEAPLDYMLWNQLNAQCSDANNCDYVTIPHNSNLSNGKLLTPYVGQEPTLENKIIYAETRLEREPLMEIFQHKGASECVNGLNSILGAVDELCDIEQVRVLGETARAQLFHLEGTDLVPHDPVTEVTAECDEGELGDFGMRAGGCVSRNDFLRSALITGLEEEQEIGLNPVKMGVIASTDGHYGTPGDVSEDLWRGAVSGEMTILERLEPGTLPSGIRGNPGGLAGVWAEENSRDAIFDAMKRRETFGTSGPRIVPRFFGGWQLDTNSCGRPDMVEHGYAAGVPMGGDLPAQTESSATPIFVLAAQRDAGGRETPLQQVQIIKGWVDGEGQRRYEVHTVAGSPDNGAGVDVDTGQRYGEGHDSLCGVFIDEDFDPDLPAFYYLRAVENPSPRWSLLDCLKLEESERPAVCNEPRRQVIQEMAWSSPIWYRPQ